jgi:hypothetical protein
LFDAPELPVLGAKVGVTATSISNATTFIFSNYNGKGTRKVGCGKTSPIIRDEAEITLNPRI